MSIFELDPLRDPRWPEFLHRHPGASAFHTQPWLQALKNTYGYEPVVYTTSPPGAELNNGWVFCQVSSWLTGRRLVSLPFSDHCDPLVDNAEEFNELAQALRHIQVTRNCKYLEYRPLTPGYNAEGFTGNQVFHLHTLNLQPDLSDLFKGMHKDSTQRKIRRAEREGLTVEEGRSEPLLHDFYRLLIRTRRRHRLPPQPRDWFSNLASCLGEQFKVSVAYNQRTPVAGIITLRFRQTLMYKYGAADERFFSLGGMQMLLWRAVQEGKRSRLLQFDLGRSDTDAEGLVLFKDRLGARRTTMRYFVSPARRSQAAFSFRNSRHRRRVLLCVPGRVLAAGGTLFYRHFA